MNLTEATDKEIKLMMDGEWEDHHDMKKYLIDNGFKEIGYGAYSDVFAKPGYKRVIKIKRGYYYGDEDDGWADYMKFCRKNWKKNKYLPKIYYIRYRYPPAAVLERLLDFRKYEHKVPFKDLYVLALHGVTSVITGIVSRKRKLGMNINPKDVSNYINMNRKELQDEPLSETIYDIKRLLIGRWGMNLNRDNIMLRPRDYHVVLTDPVVG